MSRVSVLWELQQTDSKIDTLNTSITNIDRNLADTSAIEASRQATAEAEKNYVTARSKQRELEATAQQQEGHANDLEQKLYGGQIKGQKEMASAQTEIATYRQRKKETDDATVEAMVVLEGAEKAFKEAKEKGAATEAEWDRATKAYREERIRLESESGNLKIEREKRAKMVMPPDMPVYEKIRQQRAGVAVAEVLNGKTCGKCRVELPMAKQREIKGGNQIVNCPSCGRILYHKF